MPDEAFSLIDGSGQSIEVVPWNTGWNDALILAFDETNSFAWGRLVGGPDTVTVMGGGELLLGSIQLENGFSVCGKVLDSTVIDIETGMQLASFSDTTTDRGAVLSFGFDGSYLGAMLAPVEMTATSGLCVLDPGGELWVDLWESQVGARVAHLTPFAVSPPLFSLEARASPARIGMTDDALFINALVMGTGTAPLVPGAPEVSNGNLTYGPVFMRVSRARLGVDP